MTTSTTPHDFPTVRKGGYDPHAVDQYTVDVTHQIGEMQNELIQLRTALAAATRDVQAANESQATVDRKLALAVETANRIVAQAETEAVAIRARTAAEIDSMRAATDARIAQLATERTEIERRHEERVSQMVADLDARRQMRINEIEAEEAERERALVDRRDVLQKMVDNLEDKMITHRDELIRTIEAIGNTLLNLDVDTQHTSLP